MDPVEAVVRMVVDKVKVAGVDRAAEEDKVYLVEGVGCLAEVVHLGEEEEVVVDVAGLLVGVCQGPTRDPDRLAVSQLLQIEVRWQVGPDGSGRGYHTHTDRHID